MQDIYYHRPRGLSTVFAKKFKIFFAKQKKVLLPPSGGGRRALFSAADSSPAPPCARGYPCALCGVLCALRCPVRPARLRQPCGASRPAIQSAHLPRPAAALCPAPWRPSAPPRRTAEKKPGRSKRSGRALFISLSGDEAQVSDQALGLPNWQSLLPESEVHISSMFRGSL